VGGVEELMGRWMAFLVLLSTSACGQALHDGAERVAAEVGDGIRQMQLEQPGNLRALFWLRCTPDGTCKSDSETLQCEMEEDTWTPAFAAEFTPCVNRCGGDLMVCFQQAVAATVPEPAHQAEAEACRDAVAQCADTVTDACDALLYLQKEELRGALLACTSADCDDLQACFKRTLLASASR
jgi:hypothetical protein